MAGRCRAKTNSRHYPGKPAFVSQRLHIHRPSASVQLFLSVIGLLPRGEEAILSIFSCVILVTADM